MSPSSEMVFSGLAFSSTSIVDPISFASMGNTLSFCAINLESPENLFYFHLDWKKLLHHQAL